MNKPSIGFTFHQLNLVAYNMKNKVSSLGENPLTFLWLVSCEETIIPYQPWGCQVRMWIIMSLPWSRTIFPLICHVQGKAGNSMEVNLWVTTLCTLRNLKMVENVFFILLEKVCDLLLNCTLSQEEYSLICTITQLNQLMSHEGTWGGLAWQISCYT